MPYILVVVVVVVYVVVSRRSRSYGVSHPGPPRHSLWRAGSPFSSLLHLPPSSWVEFLSPTLYIVGGRGGGKMDVLIGVDSRYIPSTGPVCAVRIRWEELPSGEGGGVLR